MKINTLFILSILLVSILAACTPPSPPETSGALKKFSSETELKDFLKKSTTSYSPYYFGAARGAVMEMAVEAPTIQMDKAVGDSAADFSTTNIQVEGVDEADIVKTDGKYIYVLTENKLAIVNAYPAENAKLVSEIKLDGNPREFFINDNKLIVFGNDYKKDGDTFQEILPRYSSQYAYAKIYDISDKDDPEEEEQLVMLLMIQD